MNLAKHGFVRVDGLRCSSPVRGDEYLIKPEPGNTYRWDTNNGKVVVVTPKGEVWLSAGTDITSIATEMVRSDEGLERGMFVPCSNGEEISMGDLLNRLKDPQWQPEYHFTQEAIAAGLHR